MIYNNNKYKHYWLVPIDDRFDDAMITIGLDNNSIKRMISVKNYSGYAKYIFVAYYMDGWGYNYVTDKYDCDEFYERYGLTFGGYINMREEEIEASKYNI